MQSSTEIQRLHVLFQRNDTNLNESKVRGMKLTDITSLQKSLRGGPLTLGDMDR